MIPWADAAAEVDDCAHAEWQAAPRGPGLPEWYSCTACELSVTAFEWEALYEEKAAQSGDEMRGQTTIDWSE